MDDDATRLVAAVDQAVSGEHPSEVELQLTPAPSELASPLPVAAAAVAFVAAPLLAATALMHDRDGRRVAVGLDRAALEDAVRSERYFGLAGPQPIRAFGPLSAFWPTTDGWLRTHANYPWHRQAMFTALHLPADATPEQAAAAVARRSGEDLEEAVFAAGGVAVQVRTTQEWRASAAGRAVAAEPLVAAEVRPGAAPRKRATGAAPLAGVRVLDLTRVIAGPVGTRTLGALGADVLRIDAPDHHWDLQPGRPSDTLLAKRSAGLDLARPDGRARLEELLDDADVLVHGYRPGALARFGITDGELAERYPGLVVLQQAAWGHTGPWRERRGFDSIVQAAVGIAVVEAVDGRLGALPCQLLDHGTGHLIAAAVIDGLRRQEREGGTWFRRVSLARTATWLLDQEVRPQPRTEPTHRDPIVVRLGELQAVPPPGTLDGRALTWPGAPTGFLDDPAAWADRTATV